MNYEELLDKYGIKEIVNNCADLIKPDPNPYKYQIEMQKVYIDKWPPGMIIPPVFVL